jgi:hypothetical protein
MPDRRAAAPSQALRSPPRLPDVAGAPPLLVEVRLDQSAQSGDLTSALAAMLLERARRAVVEAPPGRPATRKK